MDVPHSSYSNSRQKMQVYCIVIGSLMNILYYTSICNQPQAGKLRVNTFTD